MKIYSLIILFLCQHLCYGQITSDRLINWSAAGYKGSGDSGVAYTDVTSFGAVGDGVTDNFSSVMSAISSLNGSRGVIYFPSGEYLIRQSIQVPDSVILKGAGSDSTFLKFDLSNTIANCINVSGGSFSSNVISVLDGFYRGSSYVIVSDSTEFVSGDYAELWQANGSWDTDPIFWADNSVGQMLHIVRVSADTLFLEEPLRFNYEFSLNPSIRKWFPVKEVGIECLRMERMDNPGSLCFNINFFAALNCWVKGVESSKSVSSHVEIDQSSNIAVTGSYFHHSFEYDGVSTHGYGITLFAHSGQCKLENNIMEHLRHSFSLQTGANGNVIAYNYSLDPNRSEAPTNYGADISLHGHFPFANLFEGNVVQNIGIDQTWGPNGPLNTFLRNRIELYGLIMTSGTVQSDSLNFVGNEITNTGFLMGNYLLAGTAHYQYGNMVRGVLTPSGTSSLMDTSYYLSDAPEYWFASPWPNIGPLGSVSTNPAKQRYLSTNVKTVCELPIINAVESIPLSLSDVFPNPVSDQLYIHWSGNEADLFLSDISGKIIYSFHLSEKLVSLPVSDLQQGFYFLTLRSKGSVETKKISVIK